MPEPREVVCEYLARILFMQLKKDRKGVPNARDSVSARKITHEATRIDRDKSKQDNN